jgi:hypothetical protein
MYGDSVYDDVSFNEPSTWLYVPQDDFSNWYYLEDWEIEMCLKPSVSSFSEFYNNDYSINTNNYANAYDVTIALNAQKSVLTNYNISGKYMYEYSYYIEPLGKDLKFSLTFKNSENGNEKKIEFSDGYEIEIYSSVSNYDIYYSDYEFNKLILEYEYDGKREDMIVDVR